MFYVPGEKVRAARPSPHGTVTITEDPRGVRTLWIGDRGIRQSACLPGHPGHFEFPYSRIMATGYAFPSSPPRRALMIGLGGGSLALFLRHHFPGVPLEVVELNAVVFDLAQEWMDFRAAPGLQVHVCDGRDFLAGGSDLYDVIFLDGFDDCNLPPGLRTAGFYQTVRRRLAPGGAVLAHLWDQRVEPHYATTLASFASAFPSPFIWCAPTPGSQVVAGFTGPPQDLATLAGRVLPLADRTQPDGDLAGWFRAGASLHAPDAPLPCLATT